MSIIGRGGESMPQVHEDDFSAEGEWSNVEIVNTTLFLGALITVRAG
jgi:hypothetical protein